MKLIILIFVFVHFCFKITAQKTNIIDSVCQEKNLIELLELSKFNKELQLERMTSLVFHNMINEYRVSKKLKTLFWDEKLWLAARNHNLYLINCSRQLTHTEVEKCGFFTGRYPEDRVDFVTHNSRDFTNAGYENCHLSGFLSSIDQSDLELDEIDSFLELTWEEMLEKARVSAQDAFDGWRESMGHNLNMLNSDHLTHGTSFVLGRTNYVMFATSVFAQKQRYYIPDTLSLDFKSGWESDFEINYEENFYDYEQYPRNIERITYKYFSVLTDLIEGFQIKPNERLYKLIKHAPLNESNEMLNKRYLKSSFYLGAFNLLKFRLVQKKYVQEFTDKDIFDLHGTKGLTDFILTNPSIYNASYWAGNLQIETVGENTFKLTLYMYTLVPRKNQE
jgi:uncharacterized protein YkwD